MKKAIDFNHEVIYETRAPDGKYIVATLIDSEVCQVEKPLNTIKEAIELFNSYPGHYVSIFDSDGQNVYIYLSN